MDERFTRIYMLLGDKAMEALQNATVTVVGMGAVGGQATEALARSGIGHIRVIDCDVIHKTNINRQILAVESTLGRPKVEVAAERIKDINPNCRVETFQEFAAEETFNKLLISENNYVIDAIDSLNPKSKLIATLLERGIPFISSMGAARLLDPTQIKLGNFSLATKCPLAHMVRRRLKSLGHTEDFKCVFSTEGPCKTESSILPPEHDFYKRGRDRRPLGSSPVITSMFGLYIAHGIIYLILSDNTHLSQRDC